MARKTRILVVDDSKIYRSIIKSVFNDQADMEVIGEAANGRKALDFIEKSQRPDLVTLDVEMPEMDGLETMDRISAINEDLPPSEQIGVIMISSLTRKGADTTIKALEAGAFDFITKPESEGDVGRDVLRRQLLIKARYHASNRIALRSKEGREGAQPPPKPATRPRPDAARRTSAPPTSVRAILIGVSTGGPRALTNMLPVLCTKTQLPILIVQHMPPNFTVSLARSLNAKCTHEVMEGAEGMPIVSSKVYIAPGGRHMLVKQKQGAEVLSVNSNPPENGCRPSVDVLLRSAATVYGRKLVAMILTGMGNDGTKGLGPLKRAGAYAIAQDEASSVVWGMPGSAVESGYVDNVLPLMKIPDAIERILKNETKTGS